MRITDVKAYVVKPRYPDNAGTFEGDWTFVRIDTDEGIHGWGEASNSPGGGGCARTIELLRRLVGQDPFESVSEDRMRGQSIFPCLLEPWWRQDGLLVQPHRMCAARGLRRLTSGSPVSKATGGRYLPGASPKVSA